LELLKEDPTQSIHQIGSKLNDMGLVSSDNYLNNRVRKNEKLALQTSIVKERNDKKLHADLTPKVLRNWKTVINNKELTNADKFPYEKEIVKAAFKTDSQPRPMAPSPINIDSIQVYIASRHQDLMEDTIDITEDNKVKHD